MSTPSMKGWSSPVPGLVATEKAKVACVTQPRKPSAFTVSWLMPMARALLSNTALLSTNDIAAFHKLGQLDPIKKKTRLAVTSLMELSTHPKVRSAVSS